MRVNALPDGNWIFPQASRLGPIPDRSRTVLQRILLRLTRRAAGVRENLNVFLALVRLDAIFPRYLLFLSHLLHKGRIPRADKERIILRVAWRLGCVYEWGHHSHMAQQAGVGVEEIASIAEEVDCGWSPELRLLMQVTDELLESRSLTESSWALLRERFDENQCVEYCMLVGHYVMVAGLINSTGVRLEAGYLQGAP